MKAIHINETTQQYIADKFNDGVRPMLGKYDPAANGDDTYYIVKDDEPNDIVTSEVFWTTDLCDKCDEIINYQDKPSI